MKKHFNTFDTIAYVFQGGGALGTYQVGAFQALHEAGYNPDWVAGISIGAVNAAIIAGNAPEKRLDKLIEFWDIIATPDFSFPFANDKQTRSYYNTLGARSALLFGQPGFFRPRLINPWLVAHGDAQSLSFYDNSPLRDTLEHVIDFDRINAKEVRLSLGAIEVESGQPLYFSNLTCKIGPEHVMASAALPPGFPAVEIDGKLYWDGGVLANMPLCEVVDATPRVNTLCFAIDLFAVSKTLPTTLDEVLQRQKDITYSSHSEKIVEIVTGRQTLRNAIAKLISKLPPELQKDTEVQELKKLSCTRRIDVVYLVYGSDQTEHYSKDYNFSKPALDAHLLSGYEDTRALIATKPWEKVAPDHVGAIIHTTLHVD